MTSWTDKLGLAKPPENSSEQEVPEEEPKFIEGSFETTQVIENCRTSLDFLAGFLMPTIFKYLFPEVFKTIWIWLISYVHRKRDFSQLAIGLPRGFGKTMVIKLFVIYCILFTKKTFILIICGTQQKANNIISDIEKMLNESNMRRVFGDWKIGIETDRQDLKKFGFRGRNIVLMGAGAGSDIRGSTLNNERPDVMIFDDIQKKEEADNEVIANALDEWMNGTAMKTKSPEGCLFIFIGNMYPTKHSLLRKIKYNPTWIKFICGGITSDGKSLWEDLQPLEQLLKEYERDLHAGHPQIFFSEVLNDENASVNKLIDIGKIPEDPYEGETPQGNFIIIDPSNDKANSDAVTITYCELYDGIPVAREIIEGRLSPGASVEETLKLCLKYGCRLVAVESNAYQYSHLYWFNRIASQYGIVGIHCVDVYSGTRSKNSRILDMFKSLLGVREVGNAKPELYLGKKVRAQVFHQITSFNALKTNNVDGILDCLTYMTKVVEMYGEYILSNLTLEMQEFQAMQVIPESITCSF